MSLTAKDGEEFTQGVMRWFAIPLLMIFAINLAIGYFHHDNSDPPHGHSQMDVRTDALTGCQYLVTDQGGIIERRGATGVQICGATP